MSSLQSTEGIGQAAISGKSQWPSPRTTPIHILDDDSLLNIFYLYRPTVFDEHDDDVTRIRGGRVWDRERWCCRHAGTFTSPSTRHRLRLRLRLRLR
ncbi:hypothetical protein DFH94DRAFT_857097 [Russula ochroleuca]|uniref:Uncharacterized protein n=1 Tax=Russula ochroleuca TaxID=152965 RepID=A0A9P5MLH4_9AGAM|nr:hypothetical protein DFH94DRAFT_857097 [Russula ochroleuca]